MDGILAHPIQSKFNLVPLDFYFSKRKKEKLRNANQSKICSTKKIREDIDLLRFYSPWCGSEHLNFECKVTESKSILG